MSLAITCSFWLSLVFMLPVMAQPLSLGLCVMLLSVALCLFLAITATSWYAYILFLVYVGGLLVMFAYVSALMPNNKFSSRSVPFFIGLLFLSFLLISSLYLMDFGLLNWQSELWANKTRSQLGGSLMDPKTIHTIIILGLVLLLNLVAVVKICNPSYTGGPLRPHKL